jgi:hypothetical protein
MSGILGALTGFAPRWLHAALAGTAFAVRLANVNAR